MKKQFELYLISKGYKQFTPSGHPSTVYDYCKRIDFIANEEGLNWTDLAKQIEKILPLYDDCGPKQDLGRKSHHAVINALRRFSEFLSK